MLNFGEYLTITDALFISAVSIAVVFAVLSLIAVIITSVGKILKEEKPIDNAPKVSNQVKGQQSQSRVDLSAVVNDEHKLIATMVATIEANQTYKDVKYKITNIKEI